MRKKYIGSSRRDRLFSSNFNPSWTGFSVEIEVKNPYDISERAGHSFEMPDLIAC